MHEVYILKADLDGTLRSRAVPIGIAVTSEEAAIDFVENNTDIGYFRDYEKITVLVDNDAEEINHYLEKLRQ